MDDRAGVLGPSVIAFIGNRGGEGFELELLPEPALGHVLGPLRHPQADRLPSQRPRTGLCVVWPNLSFRASDLLGNETVLAYDIGIDNQPPTHRPGPADHAGHASSIP